MKNLKIRFGLLNLLVALIVCIGLISCEQEELPSDEIVTSQEENELLINQPLILPYGYEGAEVAAEYISNASDEEIQKMIENYKITHFLFQEELYTEVTQDLSFGEHISDIDLSKYLTEEQLALLANYIPVSERSCYFYYGYEVCCVTHPLYGTSCSYTLY